jgi:hypothetical protein
MTYGLQIFAADGVTKTFDSTTAVGGCVVDIVTAKSYEITISYDAFDSYRTAYATIIGGVGSAEATPGYNSGHPTITIPAYYSIEYDPGVYMVFIL